MWRRIIETHAVMSVFVGLALSRPAICDDGLTGYSVQNLEQMAVDASNKSNFSAGIAFLDEILRRDPHNLGARSSRGRLLFDTNDFEGALREFDYVVVELKGGKRWTGVTLEHLLHRQAYTLHALRRFNDAEVAVDAALAIDPNYVNALNTRGNILKDSGKLPEAFKAYQSAANLAPTALFPQTNLINVAVELKAYDEAMLYCRNLKGDGARAEAQVITGGLDTETLTGKTPVNPAPVLMYWNCAVAFRDDGSHDKEYHEFLELAASAPVYDAADFFYRAQARRALSQFDGALQDYTESLHRGSRKVETYDNKGRILYDQKKFEEAYRMYGDFVDAHPEEGSAYQGRASVLSAMGKFQEALPDAQRGVELSPNEAFTWNTLGWIYQQMGDLNEAQDAYARALALDPTLASPRSFLAFRHQEGGEYDKVVSVLKPLVDSGSADAVELSRYGFGLLKLGRMQEALAALDASIGKDPSNAFAFSQRAWLLSALGRVEEAKADAERARQINPTDQGTIQAAEFYKRKSETPTERQAFAMGTMLGAFFRVKLQAASQ